MPTFHDQYNFFLILFKCNTGNIFNISGLSLNYPAQIWKTYNPDYDPDDPTFQPEEWDISIVYVFSVRFVKGH